MATPSIVSLEEHKIIVTRLEFLTKHLMGDRTDTTLEELKDGFFRIYPEFKENMLFSILIDPIHAFIRGENLMRVGTM
jgi:hypothetical protein